MKSIVEKINESRQLGKGWKMEKEGLFEASILSFDEPSEEYGIDGGKISKLYIVERTRAVKVVCNYDRGWDVRPTKEVKEFYEKILKKYN